MVRLIETPDFGVSDYNAAIISRRIVADPRRVAEAWEAAMRSLPPGDVLHIQKIPEVLGNGPNPLVGLSGMRPESYASWRLALPHDLRDLEQQALSASTRRQIRRRTRQLECVGNVRYFIPGSVAEKQALFQTLSDQRQARFAALGRRNILSSAPHREFYERLIEGSADSDVVVIHALKVGEETIATAFGLYWQGRFYLLMSTMADGKWMEFSPGVVMIWKLIATMHEKGCRCVDFTIGDEAYKRQLGARAEKICQHVRCLSPAGVPFVGALLMWRKSVAMKRLASKYASFANSVRPSTDKTARGLTFARILGRR
jgi:CelD/BcsL family acetyltransferase involved in cellulose biosynthesis